MNERSLKDLFCAFCGKKIADHHIKEESARIFYAHWRLYQLHCAACGHNSYVSCKEAEK
jgi:hypothetical protein